MLPAATALQQFALGKETVRGTAVAATERLQATAQIVPEYTLHRSEAPSGVLVQNVGPTPLVKKEVAVTLDGDATFEQIGWWLSLALDQPVSTINEHIWDPGVAALWDAHSMTLEGRHSDGTNFIDVEIEYLMAKTLRLRGEQNGVLQLSAECFGRQITDATITALSVTDPLTQITIPQMKFYLNDTIALANVLEPVAGLVSPDVQSFELEIDVGNRPWHGIAGATTFAQHVETAKNFRLSITCLVNPNAAQEGLAAERVHAAAQDLRCPTLAFIGPGGAGVLDMHIALAGKHEQGEIFDITNQDGLDMVTMNFVGQHDATGAKLIAVELNNADADPL